MNKAMSARSSGSEASTGLKLAVIEFSNFWDLKDGKREEG